MAKVLITGIKHLSNTNLPRKSRHMVVHAKPFPSGRYPLEKVWQPLSSFSFWRPVWKKHQIIHSFNKIIQTKKTWFITFEDHSFLYINPRNKVEALAYEHLNNRLGLENCKKLIAMSDYAKMRCLTWLDKNNRDLLEKVVRKVIVIQPNFPVRSKFPKSYKSERLQLLFVGNHLARKGGIVALRLAKKAEKIGLPIDVHIISELKHGAGVPTDFPDKSKYADDLKLLDLPNVTHYKSLPNGKVIELLSQSHFQMLATLHDTYGFSLIEGFTVATPAITTNVCALPEFVHHEKNGYLLPLELNQIRHWKNWLPPEKRNSEEYWDILNSTYEQIAEQALQVILNFLDRDDKDEHYELLSEGALAQAKNFNNSEIQNELFDNLYAEAAGEA